MKTRVKEEQFKQVEDTNLIGIKWSDGEKGILLVSEDGIICLNNDETDIQKSFAASTKSDYLTSEPIKRDTKKVFKFENMGSLLKWFAKK